MKDTATWCIVCYSRSRPGDFGLSTDFLVFSLCVGVFVRVSSEYIQSCDRSILRSIVMMLHICLNRIMWLFFLYGESKGLSHTEKRLGSGKTV